MPYTSHIETVQASQGPEAKKRLNMACAVTAPQEVKALLDEGIYDMQKLKEGGWVTDLKCERALLLLPCMRSQRMR